MALFTVNKQGLEAMLARVTDAQVTLQTEVLQTLDRITRQTADELKEAAPVGHWPLQEAVGNDEEGHLAESFSSKVVYAVTTGAMYGVYTNQPTKLGYVTKGVGRFGPAKQPIVPRYKKALWWKGADHPTASSPGYEGKPFVDPVIQRANDGVRSQLTTCVTTVLQNLFAP